MDGPANVDSCRKRVRRLRYIYIERVPSNGRCAYGVKPRIGARIRIGLMRSKAVRDGERNGWTRIDGELIEGAEDSIIEAQKR